MSEFPQIWLFAFVPVYHHTSTYRYATDGPEEMLVSFKAKADWGGV